MPKFHINNSGTVGVCQALQGNCPFGGEADHYPTAAKARVAYEQNKNNKSIPAVLKSSIITDKPITEDDYMQISDTFYDLSEKYAMIKDNPAGESVREIFDEIITTSNRYRKNEIDMYIQMESKTGEPRVAKLLRDYLDYIKTL